jgi:hypothetical protein
MKYIHKIICNLFHNLIECKPFLTQVVLSTKRWTKEEKNENKTNENRNDRHTFTFYPGG